MGRPLMNLLGQRFGRLTVVDRADSGQGRSYWLCKCDCGVRKNIAASTLKSGNTKSCGCLNKEASSKRAKIDKVTHGQSKTALYVVWQSMIRRCDDPRVSSYRYYGARGITVCAQWMHFEDFYKWAEESGYRHGLTIDRKDNDGHYSPENCRWATKVEQGNNRRTCVRITINETRKTVSEWARHYGISPTRVHQRIRSGWNPIRALTEPLHGGAK